MVYFGSGEVSSMVYFGEGHVSAGLSTRYSMNDRVFLSLYEYRGSLNDKLFGYLRGEGYTGSLTDMIYKAGGWKQVLSDLDIEIN